MAYQNTFSTDPAIAYAGMPADSSGGVTDSFLAEGAVVVGLLCQRGTDKARQVAPVTSLTASATAILASGGASAATAQTVTSFNGATGTGLIIPAQQLSMVLSNSADWDATTAVFKFENAMGEIVEEEVAIPNNGNTTIKTIGAARRIISLYIPAQTGTGGTYTVGTSPDAPVLTLRDFPGIAMYDASREPYTTSNQYTSGDPCPVRGRGTRTYVVVEDAVNAGDPVYVRTTTSGADVAGQFGGEKAANFGVLIGARYVTGASTDGLAIVELG